MNKNYDDEISSLKSEVYELRSMVNELRHSESGKSEYKTQMSEKKLRKLDTSPSVIKIQI